jgi:hypothetical protein
VRCSRNILGALIAGLAVLSAQAQQHGPPAAGSAQGTLTVSVRVVTSVGLVIGPNSEPQIVAANATDPRDNVSSLQQSDARTSTSRAVSAPPHSVHEKSKRPRSAPVRDK